MRRLTEYLLFFLATVLLQLLLFDNIDFSVWVHPLFYIVFLMLLPMELSTVAVLGIGFLLGVVLDVLTGGAGLNTAATLPIALLRKPLLLMVFGRDTVEEGGAPLPGRLGIRRFMLYAALVVVLHGVFYFSIEALSFRHFAALLLRAVAGGAITLVCLRFAVLLAGTKWVRRL